MPFDFFSRLGAGETIHELSILEEEHGGGAANRVFRCGRGILIHVQFGNLYSARVIPGQLIKDGRQPLAVPAPGSIEFQQDRTRKGQDLSLKVPIEDFDRMAGKWGRKA